MDYSAILSCRPLVEGRSKRLYKYDDDHYIAQLIPSLSSFTYNRHEMVENTDKLRLDFYEMAVEKLNKQGIKTAFVKRIGEREYLTRKCSNPPFEVIVKNFAVGSTLRKYPDLFEAGYQFKNPVVKFDYRTDPEDQPISEDYLREYGEEPKVFKEIILSINSVLCQWLNPLVLIDFCVIFGRDKKGDIRATSEISPDCMRLKTENGDSFDKDLFRQGKDHDVIVDNWKNLIERLKS